MRVELNLNKRRLAFDLSHDPSFAMDRDIKTCLSSFGCPEPEIVHVMIRALKDGSAAIDCGAGVGFFSIVMSRLVGPTGKVFAVEPAVNNLPKLNDNVRMARADNVKVLPFAAWDDDCNTSLFLSPHSGFNSLMRDTTTVSSSKVSARKLDTLFPYTKPRLIKIDVEGAELHVLKGAETLLTTRRPLVLCEISAENLNRFYCSRENVFDYMHDLDYSAYYLYSEGIAPTEITKLEQLPYREPFGGYPNVLFATPKQVAELWREREMVA